MDLEIVTAVKKYKNEKNYEYVHNKRTRNK